MLKPAILAMIRQILTVAGTALVPGFRMTAPPSLVISRDTRSTASR